MRSAGRWFLLLACLWFASAGAGIGLAQSEDPNVVRARELFQRGVDAYDRGAYAEALSAFQDAYQLRPHPAVRVNIANCYDKLDRPAEAIQNFEQFLGSGAGTPKQQEEVVQALDQLRKRTGRLVLRVSPEGARIVIDNAEPLRAPVADVILLKSGRHQLTASLDKHETAMRTVDIAAAATTELTINLPLLGAAPAVAAVPPGAAVATAPPPAAAMPAPVGPLEVEAAPDDGGDIPASVWIAGGVTLAAVLTSVLTGQLALAADRDFNSDLAAVRNTSLPNDQRATAWDDGNSSADRARSFAVATDVLLSCAVVGAVLTTVLYLNNRTPNETSVRASGSQLQLKATF